LNPWFSQLHLLTSSNCLMTRSHCLKKKREKEANFSMLNHRCRGART
jgi:hypothetical protein